MISTEQKSEIIRRRAAGESIRTIAKAMSLSPQTIVDYCKEAKERIAAASAIELDSLLETEHLALTERLKAQAALVARLKAAIDSRDLDDVPTEKLIDLYLKAGDKLSEMMIEPILLSEDEIVEEEADRKTIESLSAAG